jgi:hypothetical protein
VSNVAPAANSTASSRPLEPGGAGLMPLAAYPFAQRFAWVNDRFGVSRGSSGSREIPQQVRRGALKRHPLSPAKARNTSS